MKGIYPTLALIITVVIAVLLFVVSICFIFWFVEGGNTVSINTIEELTITTEEATIHIKGLHTEISNRWLNELLDVIKEVEL